MRSNIETNWSPVARATAKDQIGLAPVKIENDPTLKRGDIVAGADGLMVNRGADRRGASLNDVAGLGIRFARNTSACQWSRRNNVPLFRKG